ncbi:SAM-dependent methyltransferase [Microbispora hainanensis]|uniref:SAM-dependent methyltransferase n=1 Tax=Microbispora hainanensis TaxID=568844 RepID=A0A544Z414_9ACTN|nr:SAM-dependent methyltransferase [Microbispora hainanensis]TQS23641.1 SAM-dependent methyltransferase [Microbispora hainanensis]
MADETPAAAKLNTLVPHPARVYDYWLGGKDNFEADRAVAEAVKAASPGVVQGARDNRAFLGRAVRFLAEQGITQFLDIGTGIPTQGNTHEVAQAVNPAARVVYVDNDPIVMVHARALLRSTPEGRTAYIEADLRDPDAILKHPDTLATLDFDQPIAVVIVGTLMFVKDEDDPFGVVKRYTDAVVPGSYLAVTHVTGDFAPESLEAFAEAYNTGPVPLTLRTGTEIGRFFDGFELVEPGLVAVGEWRPDPDEVPFLAGRVHGGYGAVGRKL